MNKLKYQVRVLEPVIVTETFETASWYRKLELQPGVYPMNDKSFGATTNIGADIPGKVISLAFPSSFCGNQFGDGNIDKDVGSTRNWRECYDPKSFWYKATSRHNGKVLIEEVQS